MARRRKPTDWRPTIKIRKPRKSRAKFKPYIRKSRKLFRSAVAFLKRKKIIPKTVDARKVVPNAKLKRVIRKNKDVLEGKKTTYKLPDNLPAKAKKALRDAGYRISKVNGETRLIVPKTQYVRKGQIYTKPTKARRGAKIQTFPLGPDMDNQIREAFKSLRDDDFMAFQIEGNNSYSIYHDADSMIRDLMGYQAITQRSIKSLTIFRVTKQNQQAYLDDGSTRRQMRGQLSTRQKAKRNLRRREARAMERGMRVSRGH